MSVNFNLLDPNMPANIAGSVYAGQQQRQQNELAKQQSQMRQQEMGMRQQEIGMRQQGMTEQAAERQRLLANQERRTTFLRDLGQKLAEGGKVLDRPTLGEMISSGIPEVEKLGFEGIKSLDEQQQFEEQMGRIAPKAEVAPAGIDATAPANALSTAAAPTNALTAGYSRPQVEQMLISSNPKIREMGKNLLGALPKPVAEPTEIASMRTLGLPLTQAGYQQYRDAQRQERMLSPEEEKQRIRIAAASRSPAQPVAPTITQIVDPSNPNQMITIDARRYQGGGAGAPGVIGVGGKEPGAALRQNKVEAGKTQLADDLDNLRNSFEILNKMKAIPSIERDVISNISSATAASGVGQMLGRATGTEAQVERDVINSARQRLVNSIKNATGMSAQQLNSNVELQTMLKSISDPGQSFQAAMRIIDDIQNAYVNGTGELPKRSQTGKVTSTLAPADKQALDWANSNPKDPRALQIKQRLGQ